MKKSLCTSISIYSSLLKQSICWLSVGLNDLSNFSIFFLMVTSISTSFSPIALGRTFSNKLLNCLKTQFITQVCSTFIPLYLSNFVHLLWTFVLCRLWLCHILLICKNIFLPLKQSLCKVYA